MNPTAHPPAERTEYLSVSSAKLYLICPAAWHYEKREKAGRMQATIPAMQVGTVGHAALEEINRHYLRHGKYPAATTVPGIVERAVAAQEESTWDPRFNAHLIRLVTRYLTEVAPLYLPSGAEEEFYIHVQDVPIYGIIDLQTADGLYDYKVTRTPTKDAIGHGDQLHVYALAWRAVAGAWPSSVGVINLVRESERVAVLELALDITNVQRTVDSLSRVWYGIQAGRFSPNPGLHCSKCNFSGRCEAGSAYLRNT